MAIPLLTPNRELFGFLLMAGINADYAQNVGRYEGDCVFMSTPSNAAIFEDPSYLTMEDHRAQGEHHLTIINDGTSISMRAISTNYHVLYLTFPKSGDCVWGIERDHSRIAMGFLNPLA